MMNHRQQQIKVHLINKPLEVENTTSEEENAHEQQALVHNFSENKARRYVSTFSENKEEISSFIMPFS
jgi:hypothetical protein